MSTAGTVAVAPQVDRTGIRRAIIAATVGTVIEWFDYALYGAASGLVINKLFFPDFSQVEGQLAAFATFAVGFFFRPLGGIVISHFGDRFGRKPALIFTIALAWVMLNSATSKDNQNNSFYGLAIGFTVLAGAVAVGGISGGVFNPAVALGGAVMSMFAWSTFWIYLVVELVAGALAGIAFLAINTGDK